MMHTEKYDISNNEKRLLHMIKGSKDPKAAADVAIDVIRAFLGPTTVEDRAFLEAIQDSRILPGKELIPCRRK